MALTTVCRLLLAQLLAPQHGALERHDGLSSNPPRPPGAYRISVELPGVEEGDIDLQAHDGVLTLKGEKKTEREEKGETWYFSERQYGAFSRSFRLPPDADEANVSAELKDGVLHVTVPKTAPEVPEAKKVKISKS